MPGNPLPVSRPGGIFGGYGDRPCSYSDAVSGPDYLLPSPPSPGEWAIQRRNPALSPFWRGDQVSITLTSQVWTLDLSPTEKIVLLAFVDSVDDQDGLLRCTVENVAERTNVPGRTVETVLTILSQRGVLQVVTGARLNRLGRVFPSFRVTLPQQHCGVTPQPKTARTRRNWISPDGSSWQKERAQKMLYAAVRRGDILRAKACEDCGDCRPKLQGHHHDYTQPIAVSWLCPKCHRGRHTDTGNPISLPSHAIP